MAGSTKLFVFCIVFLTVQGLILFLLENSLNPTLAYDNVIEILNVEPPPAPNFSSENPFAFINSLIIGAGYAVAISVYVIILIISLISFPFLIAARVLIFNQRYPFLMIINGTTILFLAYVTISRLTGGD